MLFFRISQPVCLGGMIRYFNNADSLEPWVGILFAMGVALTSFLYICSHHPYFFGIQHTGMRFRISSCSLIYRKVAYSCSI